MKKGCTKYNIYFDTSFESDAYNELGKYVYFLFRVTVCSMLPSLFIM